MIRVQILFEARLGLGLVAEDVVAVVIDNASKKPGRLLMSSQGCPHLYIQGLVTCSKSLKCVVLSS